RHDDVPSARWPPPEAPAQNPCDEDWRKPDADHVNVESVVPDNVVQPAEHRVEQNDRMLIHSPSFLQALTARATGSRVLPAPRIWPAAFRIRPAAEVPPSPSAHTPDGRLCCYAREPPVRTVRG